MPQLIQNAQDNVQLYTLYGYKCRITLYKKLQIYLFSCMFTTSQLLCTCHFITSINAKSNVKYWAIKNELSTFNPPRTQSVIVSIQPLSLPIFSFPSLFICPSWPTHTFPAMKWPSKIHLWGLKKKPQPTLLLVPLKLLRTEIANTQTGNPTTFFKN